MNLTWINFSNPVSLWWIFLVFASLINITAWTWTKIFLYKKNPLKNLTFTAQNLIWFSAFYVFGCAYRSFFPKADVQRICLFDTWFSSVFLGRSVATIAEVAFVIQWAIVLKYLAIETNDTFTRKISKIIVPLIIIAECFSWYAVITTNYLGNTCEESLWALTYFLIMIALIRLRSKFIGAFKAALSISIFSSCLYVLFMILVDIRMYIDRFLYENSIGKKHLGFIEGLIDLNSRWIVTYDINDWRHEIPWMSLYFSFAVLVSIGLCYVPLSRETLKKHLLNRSAN